MRRWTSLTQFGHHARVSQAPQKRVEMRQPHSPHKVFAAEDEEGEGQLPADGEGCQLCVGDRERDRGGGEPSAGASTDRGDDDCGSRWTVGGNCEWCWDCSDDTGDDDCCDGGHSGWDERKVDDEVGDRTLVSSESDCVARHVRSSFSKRGRTRLKLSNSRSLSCNMRIWMSKVVAGEFRVRAITWIGKSAAFIVTE
jgi:hypothetical protein